MYIILPSFEHVRAVRPLSTFELLYGACVQDKMLSMAVANHVLWPLAKFVNAKLVPKQHQPVANKVVQVTPLLFAFAIVGSQHFGPG